MNVNFTLYFMHIGFLFQPGTLYKIGDVLPQDTGNCLQCVCIEGTTGDDTPRVTCSPHNCPPLVLPDLFDATGY
ncbi:unnamed protein product [Ceratitis capitata]|uniref:(Mediterranean fruit fly) hypothetical protein n=1 Tax=Ceratitis capitata TaxID=7213 RepID=A0A811VG19_CERCA|nr:unnamed protein product [Ceratitis capitata]